MFYEIKVKVSFIPIVLRLKYLTTILLTKARLNKSSIAYTWIYEGHGYFFFFFLNNSKASSHDEDIGHNKISSKAKNSFSMERAYADLRLIF